MAKVYNLVRKGQTVHTWWYECDLEYVSKRHYQQSYNLSHRNWRLSTCVEPDSGTTVRCHPVQWPKSFTKDSVAPDHSSNNHTRKCCKPVDQFSVLSTCQSQLDMNYSMHMGSIHKCLVHVSSRLLLTCISLQAAFCSASVVFVL